MVYRSVGDQVKIPAGQKLKEGMGPDYLLSRLQDRAASLQEELKMIVSRVEAFREELDNVKRELGFPVGSLEVRGPDDFFEA